MREYDLPNPSIGHRGDGVSAAEKLGKTEKRKGVDCKKTPGRTGHLVSVRSRTGHKRREQGNETQDRNPRFNLRKRHEPLRHELRKDKNPGGDENDARSRKKPNHPQHLSATKKSLESNKERGLRLTAREIEGMW